MAESVMLEKAKDFAVDIVTLCKEIKESNKNIFNTILHTGIPISHTGNASCTRGALFHTERIIKFFKKEKKPCKHPIRKASFVW